MKRCEYVVVCTGTFCGLFKLGSHRSSTCLAERHLQRALDNGVTIEELKGMITHVAFYSGWPTAVNAGRVLQKVLEKTGD